MSRRSQALNTRIQQIKRQLADLGELRPGSISRQYNVCGTPDCRCKADPPRKHGPYYQISFTRKGRSRSEYLRPADVALVRRQLRNYQRLRRLMDAWIEAALEMSRLQLSPDRGGRPAPRTTKTKRRPASTTTKLL